MGQGEVIDLLKKYNKPLSIKQITDELQVNKRAVCKSLKVLLRFEEIYCMELDRFQAHEYLKTSQVKRRTFVYFLPELGIKKAEFWINNSSSG